MSGFGKRYSAFDRFQQRHRWLGFPLAVLQKYADDQGGYLAATITYYGFFAIFPLLLVLTTVLGFVLHGHHHLEQRIVNSALGQFPVIGPQLSRGSLHGSTLALGLGLAAALWAGMGVFLAAAERDEPALGRSLQAPARRPCTHAGVRSCCCSCSAAARSRRRFSPALATVGAHFGIVWKIGSIALSTALNIGLFWLGFRVLTAREVSWRQLRGGAIAAGVLYELLQTLGGYYVGHTLKHASNVYGTFGLVIGLLSWIYLGRPHHAARRRGERRRDQEALAAQLLAHDRTTGHPSRQARAHPTRQDRGTPPRRNRQRRLPHHRRGPHGCRPAAGDGLGRFMSSLTSPAGGVLKVEPL